MANLNQCQLKANGVFVIGNVQDAITLDDARISSWKKFTLGSVAAKNFIGDIDRAPFAVALLYGHEHIRKIQLSAGEPFIRLTPDSPIFSTIKKSLVDFVVFAPDGPESTCPVYDELHQWTGPDYLVRRFANSAPLSLSRCDDKSNSLERFLFRSFKLAHMSPGIYPNDCDDANPAVMVASNQNDVDEVVVGSQDVQTSSGNDVDDNMGDLDDRMDAIDDRMDAVDDRLDGITQAGGSNAGGGRQVGQIDTSPRVSGGSCDALTVSQGNSNGESSCVPRSSSSGDSDSQASVNRDRERLANNFGQPVQGEVPWKSLKHWKNEWLTHVERHHRAKMPMSVLRRKETQYFLVFYPNEQNPAQTRYGCWSCERHYSMTGENSQYHRSGFSKPEGTSISRSIKFNRNKIRDHLKSKEHQAGVEFIKEQYAAGFADIYLDVQRVQDCKKSKYAATNRFMRTCYFEASENVAFNSHNNLMTLQKLNGVDIGKHFIYNGYAAICEQHISIVMHGRLVDFILDKKPPLSVLLNESVDKSEHQFLSVLIQAPENNRATVYQYKALKMTSDGTAEAMVRLLTEQIERDGLTDIFKRNLRGCAVDGAYSEGYFEPVYR